jgi:nucleotide-binding universal stress UspA family protein
MTENRAPRHLLVAYDFSRPAERALELARDLRAALHAAVDVVHVHLDPFAGTMGAEDREPYVDPGLVKEQLSIVADHMRRRVDDVFGPEAGAVRTRVLEGSVAERILATAADVGADLILVGTTGKGGIERALLGSVSLTVLRKSPVPVLTVSA